MSTEPDLTSASTDAITKSDEQKAFLFLAVLLAPILSFVLVGSYGFLIWMSQLLLGPPGH